MLQININSNIDDYKESVLGGMDAKQSLFAILGIFTMIVAIIVMVVVLHIPMLFAVYIAMPVAMPFILTGFFHKDGMSFWERLRRNRLNAKSEALFYQSTERREVFKNY